MRLRIGIREAVRRLGVLLPMLVVAPLLAVSATGCRVHVDNGSESGHKQVQVDTPFGGVHVNTGQTTAADLGLPAYPGARLVTGRKNDKSADVQMAFGNWALRVQAVTYASSDSQGKIVAFYKNALGRFGTVIACQDNEAVGSPDRTSQGLSCSEPGKGGQHVQIHAGPAYDSDRAGYELKAGSPHHQHIVAFESSAPGETRFSLVALDLPSSSGSSARSD